MTTATVRLLAALLILGISLPAQAQSQRLRLHTSTEADCSDSERQFEDGDIVYVCVQAPAGEWTAYVEFEPQEGESFEPALADLGEAYLASADVSTYLAGSEKWTVRVRLESDDNELTARSVIQVNREDDGDDDAEEMKVEGPVTGYDEVDGAWIEVDGVPYLIDADTEFEDFTELSELSTEDPASIVKVEYVFVDPDNVALKIELKSDEDDDEGEDDGDDDDTTYGLHGVIASVAGEGDPVDLVTVVLDDDAGTTFTATPETRIQGERGAKHDLAFLAGVPAGQHVHVVLEEQAGDPPSLWAKKIRLYTPHESDDVSLTGPIEGLGEGTVEVGGLVFLLTDDTEIEDGFGRSMLPADLTEGLVVKIEGHQEGEDLVADEITVRMATSTISTFDGPVDGYAEGDEGAPGTLTVAGVDFLVDGDTRLRRGVDASQLDGRVKVRFVPLPEDGGLLALRIHERNAGQSSDPIREYGEVDTVDPLVVSGIAYAQADGIEIVDDEGNPVDLAEGDWVRVWATVEEDVLTAFRVAVREVVEMEAEVEGRVGDVFTLAGQDFLITDDTDFVDETGAPTTADALQSGAFVEVLTLEARVAVPVADQVTIQAAVATTERSDVDVPTRFTLEQNYPNPFNPATRIRFELSASSESVRLDVFNVLGQRLRTLVTGRLSAGVYDVTWDGRSDAGVPAASGVYLYRLQALGQTETRTMTLLR